ncbi:MFS transporter TsgA, partial [Citrobacter sp. TBCS-14]
FTMWTPGYLQSRFTLQAQDAALFTTVYWVTKAIGLFLNQFTVKWMKLRTFLLICASIGLVSIALIANSNNT